MTLKDIKCRDHGGYFKVPARRGRPPVRCTEEHPCNAQKIGTPSPEKAGKASKNAPVATTASATKSRTSAAAARAKSSDGQQEERSDTQSLAAAKVAKTKLDALGWTVKGKAWRDGSNEYASLTATRGEEMLYILFRDGKCLDQQYNLWNLDKPSVNHKPKSNLPFDPDEIPDSELAQYLTGVKVTWYNKLADNEETAYCGRDTVSIEHHYSGTGDEKPGDRIIKFQDPETQMFRAFRLDQLLKVG